MKIEKWYNKALESSEVGQLSMEIIEGLIDSSIDDEVLSSFPILGTLNGIRKGYNSITDHFFIKKALKVLLELGDVTIEERSRLISDLENEHCSGTEKILMSINSLDSYEKNAAFGRLCRLKALDFIGKEDFLVLSNIIQKSIPEDLHAVNYFTPSHHEKILNDGKYMNLIGLGLLYSIPYDKNEFSHLLGHGSSRNKAEIGLKYRLTENGILVHKWYDKLFEE